MTLRRLQGSRQTPQGKDNGAQASHLITYTFRSIVCCTLSLFSDKGGPLKTLCACQNQLAKEHPPSRVTR